MKKIHYFITALFILWGCGPSSTPKQKEKATEVKSPQQTESIDFRNFFTLQDAEQILGESAHLSDSSLSQNGKSTMSKSAYTANAKDKNGAKTGVVYFLIEQYKEDSSAHNVYAAIKTANEAHGIKVLNGLGDEAYFHSDFENFYFIMARKGNKMFRIKVNKITSTTSLDQFNLVAKNITARL
jgi:hypothetical protein